MAKTQNPVSAGVSGDTLRWAQSVHQTLNGNVDMGIPTGKDATGNWSEFGQGNSSGVLIRIGAASSTQANKWTTTGTAIAVNHGLQRQPIGVHLVNSDKQLQVWQPTTATATYIYLAPSDATVNATVYVF
jgi:hypothetical protein